MFGIITCKDHMFVHHIISLTVTVTSSNVLEDG